MEELSTSPALPTSAAQLMEMQATPGLLPNGKKTKGRVKIKMEYIGNKLRRYTTFSKRKTGIMKKAYELSTLTGTQVMLLVASETGHVYTFATKKLQPMISSDAGKSLIQNCLNAPDDGILDLAPNRTEFTFDNGQISNPRKRKVTESSPDQYQPHVASFLPTMVQNSLFTNFQEEEYNQDDSDESDSEEATDPKDDKELDIKQELNEQEKLKEKDISLSLQQTLKDALKAAANNRQAAKKRKLMEQQQNANQAAAQQQLSNALLAPFLLGATTSTASSSSSSNGIFQLPQGVVSFPNSEGGATATSIFAPKQAEDAGVNPLLSFPFQFNFQQLMESAALNAAAKAD